MMVGQEVDNKVSIVAWGLYPTKNKFYYEEMLKSIKSLPDRDLCSITEEGGGSEEEVDTGGDYFQGQQSADMDMGLWFGDGFKSLPMALPNSFSHATQFLCTKHLTNSMRANKSIKNTYQDAMIWAIQGSATEQEYNANMENLKVCVCVCACPV